MSNYMLLCNGMQGKQDEDMKLKVGKTYIDRSGHVTKIVGHEKGHPLPFIGDDKCGYRSDGGYLPLFGKMTAKSEKNEFDWEWQDRIVGTKGEILSMKDELMLRFRTYLEDQKKMVGLAKAHNETRKVTNGKKF